MKRLDYNGLVHDAWNAISGDDAKCQELGAPRVILTTRLGPRLLDGTPVTCLWCVCWESQ